MTTRWIDRSPSARVQRAAHTLFGDLPEPVRWLVAWVALAGAMAAGCYLLMVVGAAMVGLS